MRIIIRSRNARNKALTLPFISAIVIQVTKKKAASSPAALEQTGQSFWKAAGQLCAFVMEDDRKGPVPLLLYFNPFLFGGAYQSAAWNIQINEEIRDKEVRIIERRTAISSASCLASEALDIAAEKRHGPGQDRPAWRSRRSARSWTTANTALNRPSGKRKREKISVSWRSRRSA